LLGARNASLMRTSLFDNLQVPLQV